MSPYREKLSWYYHTVKNNNKLLGLAVVFSLAVAILPTISLTQNVLELRQHADSYTATVNVSSTAAKAGDTITVNWNLNKKQTYNFLSVPKAYAQTSNDLISGLVGYWNMNETSGNTAADLTGANPGTVTGTNIVDGKIAKARQFTDGSKIDLGSSPTLNPTGGITTSAWINLSSKINWDGRSIIKRSYSFIFNIVGTDAHWLTNPYVGFFLTDANHSRSLTCQSNTSLLPNMWYFITATYDLHNANIYINGTLDKTCPSTAPIISNQEKTTIGLSEYVNNTTASFPGTIDEVGLWNRALSAAEVQLLTTGIIPVAPTPTTSPAPTTAVGPGTGNSTLTGAETLKLISTTDQKPISTMYLNCVNKMDLNNHTTLPSSPILSGQCPFTIPATTPPGTYVIGMFAADGLTLLGNSTAITIGQAKNIYRLLNSTKTAYFWATPTEKDTLMATGQWTVEGAMWTTPAVSDPGTITIYRLINATRTKYFWATPAEKDTLLATNQWIVEGPVWNGYATQVAGTQPIYRLLSLDKSKYFWANPADKDVLEATKQWTTEGIVWYAFPPVADTSPATNAAPTATPTAAPLIENRESTPTPAPAYPTNNPNYQNDYNPNN